MKTNESNLRKWQKKLILGPTLTCLAQIGPQNYFPWVLTLLNVIHYCELSLYAVSRTIWQKTSFLGLIQAHWTQIPATNFFFKNLALSVTDIMVSYHHVQYQKKTNDPILRKLSKGRKDRQTDESDFIRHFPTNVEHPT